LRIEPPMNRYIRTLVLPDKILFAITSSIASLFITFLFSLIVFSIFNVHANLHNDDNKSLSYGIIHTLIIPPVLENLLILLFVLVGKLLRIFDWIILIILSVLWLSMHYIVAGIGAIGVFIPGLLIISCVINGNQIGYGRAYLLSVVEHFTYNAVILLILLIF